METCSYLGEANGSRVLTEALTADVETVLADQTSGVSADTAIRWNKKVKGLVPMYSSILPRVVGLGWWSKRLYADSEVCAVSLVRE